jgi:hypothetical protein
MYMKVMEDIRRHIAAGTFKEFREQFARTYVPTQKVLAGREGAMDAASDDSENAVAI